MEERILTPQQESFLSYYINPKSETFGNARASALKAGYSENYANNITVSMPEWLLENVGKSKMIKKAEKNIDEMLDMPIEVLKFGDKDIVKTDPSLIKIKQDTSKFVVERLDKNNWSQRQEHTGKDGGDIKVSLSKEEQDKIDEVLKNLNVK